MCLPLLLPFFHFLLLLHHRHSAVAEMALWRNNATELRSDGSCWVLHEKGQPTPAKTSYKTTSKQYANCGDPDYEVMRQCQMVNFYGDRHPASSDVMTNPDMDDALLFLLDGCLRCPYGVADATVHLVFNMPSGGLFSSCSEKRVVISSVNVQLTVRSSIRRDYHKESDGTFALGGILRERNCGLFGLYDTREMAYEGLVLEVQHNCGRQKSMLLKVPLPRVETTTFKDWNKLAEMTGLSMNLAIYGPGWDERTVDYNLIRPQQTQKQIASHNNENDGKRRTDARKPAPAVPKPKETPVEKQASEPRVPPQQQQEEQQLKQQKAQKGPGGTRRKPIPPPAKKTRPRTDDPASGDNSDNTSQHSPFGSDRMLFSVLGGGLLSLIPLALIARCCWDIGRRKLKKEDTATVEKKQAMQDSPANGEKRDGTSSYGIIHAYNNHPMGSRISTVS